MTSYNQVFDAINKGKPRTHSYGFAQIYLSQNARLHLFSGELCEKACIPDQVSVRHDHRYDFTSEVLKGCIIDQPCRFISADRLCTLGSEPNEPIEPWTEYRVRPAHEVIGVREVSHLDLWQNGNVVPTENKGYVVEREAKVIREGEKYFMAGGEFHATQHVGGTLTLFKRTDPSDRPYSRLLVPPGGVAVHSGEKQPDTQWLRARFLEAVMSLPSQAVDKIAECIL